MWNTHSKYFGASQNYSVLVLLYFHLSSRYLEMCSNTVFRFLYHLSLIMSACEKYKPIRLVDTEVY